MNNWRTTIATHFGPGCLAGVTLGDWLSLLVENRFQVGPAYWPRAAFLTGSAVINSVTKLMESLVYGRAIREVQEIPPPVFILGCWRSGTTHLHNLMCIDDRYAAPNLYQTMYPHAFLVGEPIARPLLGLFTPKQRFMDNMPMGLGEPAEDEMAFAITCRRSNMLSWAFRRNAAFYDKFLSFHEATPQERAAFGKSITEFLRKLTVRFRKPLILKSPNHTARVKLLLELFPQAKFLHLRRHPYDVYQSMCHMASRVIPVWAMQDYPPELIPDMVVETYRRLYDSFFDEQPLIPQGQYHEISYEDLATDPIGQVSGAYRALNLPDFEVVQDRMKTYADSVSNYQKNKHQEIPDAVKDRLQSEWSRAFVRWGYPRK